MPGPLRKAVVWGGSSRMAATGRRIDLRLVGQRLAAGLRDPVVMGRFGGAGAGFGGLRARLGDPAES